MTFARFLLLVLFVQILRPISGEHPEPMFMVKDNHVDIGYCFGMDYILVYRSTLDGDLLLGNSSDRSVSDAVAAGLGGRTRITQYDNLLGLQITNLTHVDSGIYWLECWANQTRLSKRTLQLSVCNQETEFKEITMKEGGRAELVCNDTDPPLEGASFRWYYQIYENLKLTLFLDSSISLRPLVEGRPGVVEVSDRGARLVVNDSVLRDYQQFFCVVIKGTDCLSVQHIYPPDYTGDTLEMFFSEGDEVALQCPAEGENIRWDTPLGIITDRSPVTDQVYVSSENFSLIIPVVSDEHSGVYLCVSSTLDFQYALVLCPKEEHQEEVAQESGSISVECRVNQDDSPSIVWHRRDQSGQDELLYDSRHDTFAIPADMRGRLTLSEDGSLLTISDLKVTDGGSYQCVVLSNPEILGDDEDYDYEEDSKEAYEDDDYLADKQRCLSKQVTRLTFRNARPDTIAPFQVNTAAAASRPSDNAAAYAVGGGLAGLMVLVAVVVGIVLKKRATASAKQRQAAPNSEALLRGKIELQRDPAGGERLAPHDNVP